MQSTLPSRTCNTVLLLIIRRITRCWMVAGAILTLGGCVSQQTYDSARQEAKARANELAQAQAEIQSLEQQRDAAQAANQRDERALGNLKSELQDIRASFDRIRKSNQAKLAALQQSIASLRARHQAMLKEISETKRHEKKLEALTAQHEQTMATMPLSLEAHVTAVDGLQQEPRLVAVITPRSTQPEESPSYTSPAPGPSRPDVPIAPTVSSSTATPPTASTIVTTSAPTNVPAKTAAVTTAASNIPPASQNESWFSSMTGWLTSMFDWIWS
jgi:hypothetical protein